jgi:ketol-acid reductoisomerase
MVAPKAPGVRELYTEGVGVPALVAVHQNARDGDIRYYR